MTDLRQYFSGAEAQKKIQEEIEKQRSKMTLFCYDDVSGNMFGPKEEEVVIAKVRVVHEHYVIMPKGWKEGVHDDIQVTKYDNRMPTQFEGAVGGMKVACVHSEVPGPHQINMKSASVSYKTFEESEITDDDYVSLSTEADLAMEHVFTEKARRALGKRKERNDNFKYGPY